MSKLIILGLAVVWAIVLLPDVLQRLSQARRSDTIGSFSDQLSTLGRANGRRRNDDNVIDLRSRTSIGRLPVATSSASPVRTPNRPAPARAATRPPAPRPAQGAHRPVSESDAGAPVVRRRAPAGAERSAPRAGTAVSMRKRRQDVLLTLGSLALLTLLATVAFGGAFLYLHLLVDVLLMAYLVALAQVTSVVPAAASRPRSRPLAPLSPLAHLDTGSVGRAVPLEASRIAN